MDIRQVIPPDAIPSIDDPTFGPTYIGDDDGGGDGFGLDAHRGDTDSRTWDRTDIDPKTVVLGVEHTEKGGERVALGFPPPRVDAACGVATARVGTADAVVFTTDSSIHGFENPGFEFHVDAGERVADGTTWNPVTGESTDGRHLDHLPTRRLFAFAWQDDHNIEPC